jgi:pimeloyl-ACP methyl ester carboxylesterase
MALLRHGFYFYRTALSRFFTLFPFRPQSLLTTKKSPAKHLTYWHRKHASKTKLPILFIHGIGIGLYPYVKFLSDINLGGTPDDQVGIIAIEIMPVSFRITHPPLSKSQMCSEIKAILAQHGWDKVVLVSHSYGSVVSTHLLKTSLTAHLIGPVLLIDPVSILLHLPDVAYNFTHRKPKRANEHQLHYFASRDIGVSHALSRHFFWAENALWEKDIEGRDVTVSLAGKDLIVNTKAVRKYLMSGDLSPKESSSDMTDSEVARDDSKSTSGFSREVDVEDVNDWKERKWNGRRAKILWFANLDHAQVFDKSSTRMQLVKATQLYCAQGFAG